MAPARVTGRFVRQPAGYRAFIPAQLPPDPPIRFDAPLVRSLAEAADAVGRLDGVTDLRQQADHHLGRLERLMGGFGQLDRQAPPLRVAGRGVADHVFEYPGCLGPVAQRGRLVGGLLGRADPLVETAGLAQVVGDRPQRDGLDGLQGGGRDEDMGWSRQRPARRAVERDDEAIAGWRAGEWRRAKKKKKKGVSLN